MKYLIVIVALTAVVSSSLASEFGAIPDSYTGIWSGNWTVNGQSSEVHAHVVRYKENCQVAIRTKPDSRLDPLTTFHFQADTLEPVGSDGKLELKVQDGFMSGKVDGAVFRLKRVDFKPSPTLGKEAPTNGIVLYDGSGLEAWKSESKVKEIGWKAVEGGAIEVSGKDKGKKFKQDISTRAELGDYELHVEFNLAYMYEEEGQHRSNSGILHFGLFETQILDSFGLYGNDDQAGAIYEIREPDTNAVFPPGLWQTYDVIARVPRFDAQGVKTENARLTVRLNGVLIHDDVGVDISKVKKRIAARGEHPVGPIVLQDHANPVQYRNVWVHPR